jgi:hypothetical protein
LPAESEQLANASAAHLLGDISDDDHKAARDRHEGYRHAVKTAAQIADALDRALAELTRRIEAQQGVIREARLATDEARAALVEGAFAAELEHFKTKLEPVVKAFVDMAALSEVLRLTIRPEGLGYRPFTAELLITDLGGRIAAVIGDGNDLAGNAIRKIPKHSVKDRADELAQIINQAGGGLPPLSEPSTSAAVSIATELNSREINRAVAEFVAANPALAA